MSGLTIWCNMSFRAEARAQLERALAATPHRLVWAVQPAKNLHGAAMPDPALETADIALGQPLPAQVLRAPRLRWTEVTTAGYTRYDTPEFWETLRARGTVFTNASSVFADPCAQHVLAMMLGLARQLPQSHRDQLTDRAWHYDERRFHSRLLTGQSVLLLGFGAIGRRLAELLTPFGVTLTAVRRQIRSERGVRIIAEENVSAALAVADHVVNLLPDNDGTRNYVNARRLACVRPGAHFYNVGRGTTVDQAALCAALESGRLGAAYLDVTEPEPLPPAHPLWAAPNCFITPHTAGGHRDQDERLVAHFLKNLAAFEGGGEFTDRVG